MVVGMAAGLGNGALQVINVDDVAKGVAAVEKIQDVGKLDDFPNITPLAKEQIEKAKHRMESELVRNGKQTELTSARAALGLSDLASLLSRIFDNLSAASKSVYAWLDDLRNTNKIKFKKTSETKVDIEYIDASGGKHKVGELIDNGDNVPSSLVHEQNGITNYDKNDLKQAFDNLDDANPATSGIACKNGSCGLIPGGCFIKGTLVKTPNGYAKIEDLKLGDEVISYNHLKKSSRVSKVKNRFERVGTRFGKLWTKNKSIESTLDHPFYVPKIDKYLQLDSLKKGMQVLALSGLLVSIDSIQVINKVENVYNLTIENDQNYFIGEAEILAHNLSSCLFKYVGINDNMLSGLNAVQKADLLKDIKASASLRLHFKSLGEADLIADIRAYKKLHKYPTLRGKPNNLSKTRQWDDITFYELDDAITLRPGLISEFENNASLFRHFEGMNSPMEFWYKYGLLREHLVSSNSFSLPTNFKATLDDIEIPVGAVDFPIPNGGSRLGDLPQGNAYSDLGKALEGELNNIIGPQNAFNAGNINNLPLPPAIKSNLQSLYDDGYRVVLQQQLNINSVNPIPDYLFVKVDNFGVADLTQPIRYIDAKLNINTSFSGAQAQLKTNYTAINNGTMPCTVGTIPNGPQLPGLTSGQTVTFVEISKWGTKLNNGRIDFTKLVVKP
jgi:hypothetical protein